MHWGRRVGASFDGGAITSDGGALLLGQTVRMIRLTGRFAACFTDTRASALVEHEVETLVMKRVVAHRLGLRGPQRPRRYLPRPGPGGAGRQTASAAAEL